MYAYINGTGLISPQNTYLNDGFLETVATYCNSRFTCIEPPYKEYLDPKLLRRMSRVIRMSVTAAKICLQNAGIVLPGAIITGTGLGCIQDTERFSKDIIENDEKLLNPASFIQSTHNTISGQIALTLGCTHYNTTYVHRGFSFETALLDSLILLQERTENVLVGGTDELTENSFIITKRLGHWKNKIGEVDPSFNDPTRGSIAGEGAGYFLLDSVKTSGTYAKLERLTTFTGPVTSDAAIHRIKEFLTEKGESLSENDLLLLGNSGDVRTDAVYRDVRKEFSSSASINFKHLCGEYHTATSFAMWLASKILQLQHIPLEISDTPRKSNSIGKILIYNHYRENNHSLLLLSAC